MTLTHLRHHQLRRAHMRLLVRAVQFAQDSLDGPAVLQAAERFFGRRVTSVGQLEQLLLQDDADVQFFPWLLWDSDLGGGPLGKRLPMRGRPAIEREIWRALLACQPSAWRIDAIEGSRARMTCLGNSREVHVDEPMLQDGPPSGEVLIARLLDLGDIWLLDAVHAALPMRCAPGLGVAAQLAEGDERDRRLRRLLKAAARAVASRPGPAPRALQQSGLRTTLIFRHGAEAATLTVLQAAAEAGTLEGLGPRRFAFLPGSAAPAGAVLRVHRERIHVSTIQPDQVDNLRRAVAALLPSATLSVTMHRDLAPLFAQPSPTTSAAELRALASDWLSEALAEFRDRPTERLGGITPRQAALTDHGRTQMRAWLRELQPLAELADPRYQLALADLTRELTAT